MTRDDIIRMVREAGAYPAANTDGALLFWSESQVERFAVLVAAAEREACAKLLESRRSGANELMDATREMEAYAIRARGETK